MTRRLLLAVSAAFLGLFLVLPLAVIFAEALRRGWSVYWAAISDPMALAALRLTFTAALIAVPLNLIFGLAAAWSIARFRFPGRSLLVTLIDLPLAVSPVVTGLMYMLIFGLQGLLGRWLWDRGVEVVFAVPGIILATVFVTLPYIARELIPLLEEQGEEEEQAARLLGASPWQMFWRVTLPNVRWALLYGVILSVARAFGEFGAVSVVSGHIRGHTNTVPLHIEILYNEFNFAGAFAVATLLALTALGTLAARSFLEWRLRESPQ